MKVVDYDYIQEISTEDALRNAMSDVSTWYNWQIPWVNTYKINAETSVYNEQGWGTGIAWWSTNVNWYSSDYNTVSRWSGSVYLPDWTELTVSSWSTGNMSTVTYIYYDQSDNTVHTTTSAWDSVWENKILLCVAAPNSDSDKDATFQAFGTDKQSTFITADNIAAQTITADEIASNSIETRHLDSYSVTADKMYVSELSAISADLWSITAWSITGTTITASDWTSKIVLDPSDWEITIYRNNSYVWSIRWNNETWVWNCVGIVWTNTAVTWKLWCLGRLRIPVWSDLY